VCCRLQLGSRKFGNLLVFVFVSAGVLQLAALLSAPAAARALPGGPYAQIGALAVFFNRTSRCSWQSKLSTGASSLFH
jgi:hypothetical protein